MGEQERAHRLDKLLKARRTPVSMAEIMALFDDCSESTAKRTIRWLKDQGAPIYCVAGLGYRYDKRIAFELTGVWFSPEELHALLTIDRLAACFAGGAFENEIGIIREKADALLGSHVPAPEEMRRIRVLTSGSRSKALPMFAAVASAVLERRRLHLVYHGRQRGRTSEREVSPQRLVHYKGNWYLDAWCHQAKGLRSFAVEKIRHARRLERACRKVPQGVLDKTLTRSFGIFSGEPAATAVLRFSEFASRWVRDEEWFPDQQSRELEDGGLELHIPYADPTELIMEICRYGPDVEVISPPELRDHVAQRLLQATDQYR